MSGTVGPRNSIITDGLVFYIDPANPESYVSGSTTTNSLVGDISDSLLNGVNFSPNRQGIWVFDGVDDYIEVLANGNGSIFAVQDYTLDMWFTSNFDGTYDVLWSFDYVNHTNPYYSQHLRINRVSSGVSGNIIYAWNVDGTTFDSIGFGAITTGWQNCCVTKSPVETKVYLNGILKNTKTYTSHTVSYYNQEIWIGKPNFSANGPAKGNFSTVKFYNKVLTGNQVLQNYNALKGRFGL
jgi:hypothetical protein